LLVDSEGRPLGDFDLDCDVDGIDFQTLAANLTLDGFAEFQNNFTGARVLDGPCTPNCSQAISLGAPITNPPDARPPNDACSNAICVATGSTTFSTLSARTDGPVLPAECVFFGDSQVGSDIWFCHPAPCTDRVVVSLCGSEYDTKMAVYDGCACPPGTPIACSDDDCGPESGKPSRVVFPAEWGRNYLIRVGGFAGAQGSGLVTVFCESDSSRGPAACGDGAGTCFTGNGTPACDDPACCAAVCEYDPYCCDVMWDNVCATETDGRCTGFAACQTSHDSCFVDHAPREGCQDSVCCEKVCAIEELCCSNAWDEYCADLATRTCVP